MKHSVARKPPGIWALDLAWRKCKPCKKNTPRIEGKTIGRYLKQISEGWYVKDDKRIKRKFKLRDFREAIAFVNKIAELAEEEGHHPDLGILWNILDITLWTHAIGGLSENDFILAAKIDEIYDTSFRHSDENAAT